MFLTILSLFINTVYYVFSTFYFLLSWSHTVLPFGLDVGLLGFSAYYLTRLRKPELENVVSIFGPEPWTKESQMNPDKVVRCIAHRGAGLDAPENSMEAFKYCVEHECNIIEVDVRSCKDGKLVLLHDQGLERLAGTSVSDVRAVDWAKIKDIDVGATHPNRKQFKDVRLCLLDDALDYLLANNMKVIIDVKGEDKQVVNGVLNSFASRPELYKSAAITCFNPFVLYQIRRSDPQIVGCLSYRPYSFSSQDYDAEKGPNNPRFAENLPMHSALRFADMVHALLWRWSARWCAVSAVLLHKDIVSPSEIQYWRLLGIRCAGWCVNRPLEKLYWRGVLKAPYLANTLLGEPDYSPPSDGYVCESLNLRHIRALKLSSPQHESYFISISKYTDEQYKATNYSYYHAIFSRPHKTAS